MGRPSKIKYNPNLSVEEMARRSGLTDDAVRYYIHSHGIDRRFDRKKKIIEDCKKVLKEDPKATWQKIAKLAGYTEKTIRPYHDFIRPNGKSVNIDSLKTNKKSQGRDPHNIYVAHPSVTQDLLRVEEFEHKVLEPFCGTGIMADVIKKTGHEVLAYDLVDRGYGEQGDFFEVDFPKKKYDIISNPPYDDKLTVAIKRCISLCKGKVALLMPIRYLSGKERYSELYEKFPPARVYVYCERINIAKGGDFDAYSDSGSNPEMFAWYVWERGYKGETELKWIHNVVEKATLKRIKPKDYEVTILDGIPFRPYEEFHIPVSDCIQFHSLALPENRVLSNHYECIITFRGVDFYGLEQLYAALTYSDSPRVVKEIMACKSGQAAKSLCNHQYPQVRDKDFEEKRYRLIALCHLFKYLSVKEFRDRLRDTYPQTLVECPNGKDFHFGMVQNLDTNFFEGNNCSGRTMSAVRDMMKKREDEWIVYNEELEEKEYSEAEKEEARDVLYDDIRQQFENDKQVVKDSKQLLSIIEKFKIPKSRERRPVPFKMPVVDRDTKCLAVDFDDTLFDTSADDAYRKGKVKDMAKAMEMIPKYKLFEGWREVIDWAQKNGVKFAILSGASGKLIEKAIEYFNIPCAAIVGFQSKIHKPHAILGNMLQEKLNIRHEQIFYVGDSVDDLKQAKASQFRFIGATWHSSNKIILNGAAQTVKTPNDIIPILEAAGWGHRTS